MKITSQEWHPKKEADKVLAQLTLITAPEVRGAHDADFVIIDGTAYIVYLANDKHPGHNATWVDTYVAMSIVDVESCNVEEIIRFAASEISYDNLTLPVGACFVPRIIRLDDQTLRCYFASEQPTVRESQTWYIDFDLGYRKFGCDPHPVKLRIGQDVVPMQPHYLYEYATSRGLNKERQDFGMYLIDSFKKFDGRTYAIINNFPIGQNALAIMNDEMDTFELMGTLDEPFEMKLTEASVNRLPDGAWLAITRREDGDKNYVFSRSFDGRSWSPHTGRDFISGGTNSKATFDKFNSIYYLGWQDASCCEGVHRSIFNIDVSRDGEHWEQKYRFETKESFQYPVFREFEGAIYVAVTQGKTLDGKTGCITFGKLEDIADEKAGN